jgi:hypothetical protein
MEFGEGFRGGAPAWRAAAVNQSKKRRAIPEVQAANLLIRKG